MAVLRMTEIHRRRKRKLKLLKLRVKYKEAKSAIDKEKIASKVAKVAPWLSEDEFAAPLKKR